MFVDAIEIQPEDLSSLISGEASVQLVDVREEWERQVCALPGSIELPMSALPDGLDKVAADEPAVIICHHGTRSLQVALWLRDNGFAEVVSLSGGLDAWARRIDPAMPRY